MGRFGCEGGKIGTAQEYLNAGYDIDKMMLWKQMTGCDVTLETDIQSSTVTYWFKNEKSGRKSRQNVTKE